MNRRPRLVVVLPAAAAWFAFGGTVLAETTRVDVRVISKGAKFVGTSMGGAEVIIRDADTDEILAQGKTAGSTGDTAKIMTDEARHHAPVSTGDAAVFQAVIDLEEPRRIEVSARGPLAQPQAANTVRATQWVVPGKPITGGDGFLLELPGLVVDVLSPPAHLKLAEASPRIQLRANVTMMCGCPIIRGGLWDADRIEVAAIIRRDGKLAGKVELNFAEQPSDFSVPLEVNEPGVYEVTVYAYDPADGNTGVDKTTFVIDEPKPGKVPRSGDARLDPPN
jgi:hypothetical protein